MTVYDTNICHQREQFFIITFGEGLHVENFDGQQSLKSKPDIYVC